MNNDKPDFELDEADLHLSAAENSADFNDRLQIDDLITRLTQLRPDLRPAEKRVADVVLRDIESAIRASNSQLAQAAGVSEPTVTRFCRALGCEGVRDFKLRLAQSLVAGAASSSDATATERTEAPYWNAVFGQARQAIRLAERQLDPAAAQQAVEQIAGAKRVFVFGVGGGSTSLAQDMQFRLFRFGVSVVAYTDPYLMRMVVATAQPGDVVIAISATGRTRELLDVTEIAQRYGAKVVSLTRPGTELAESADISLTIEVPEILNVLKPTASRFAFLAALDLLATGVAYHLGPDGQETLRRVKLNLMSIRGGDVLEPLGD